MEYLKRNKTIWTCFVIAVLHIVGLFGLQSSHFAYFEKLTALNLLISFLLVVFSITDDWKSVWKYFGLSFAVGMLVEIIGVNTSFPFGSYYYPELLSLQILGVPIIIGINWFLLSYGILTLCNRFLKNIHLGIKAMISGVIMTFMDFLIEPFAIHHGLWVWETTEVPFQNYLAWLVVSFMLFIVGYKILPKDENKTATFLILVFVIFFGLNNLLN